jgi:deferrochelatase/peroxidase EfeB
MSPERTAPPSFHGAHQPGIATRQQDHLAFAAFDVTVERAAELRDLLAAWSAAAERLMAGRRSAADVEAGIDSGEANELAPARLTITFGLGPGLFERDRLGLADRAPTALRPLPPFACDALDPDRCGGDLCVQACADGVQVAFHAVRTLARVAAGAGAPRWAQTGFIQSGDFEDRGTTPRNLWGFREGARNVRLAKDVERHVWVAGGDRAWMAGGTYLVTRRIRARPGGWDGTPVGDQQRAIGREKVSGATLEEEPGTHMAIADGRNNAGARMLRRSYNYFDGVDRAGGELDAGLFFMAFVRDPRRQFVPIQRRLADEDRLSRFAVHTASAVFAIPPGARKGGFVGDGMVGGSG